MTTCFLVNSKVDHENSLISSRMSMICKNCFSRIVREDYKEVVLWLYKRDLLRFLILYSYCVSNMTSPTIIYYFLYFRFEYTVANKRVLVSQICNTLQSLSAID